MLKFFIFVVVLLAEAFSFAKTCDEALATKGGSGARSISTAKTELGPLAKGPYRLILPEKSAFEIAVSAKASLSHETISALVSKAKSEKRDSRPIRDRLFELAKILAKRGVHHLFDSDLFTKEFIPREQHELFEISLISAAAHPEHLNFKESPELVLMGQLERDDKLRLLGEFLENRFEIPGDFLISLAILPDPSSSGTYFYDPREGEFIVQTVASNWRINLRRRWLRAKSHDLPFKPYKPIRVLNSAS